MLNKQGKVISLMFAAAVALSSTAAGGVYAATADDLKTDANHRALQTLYKTNLVAKDLSKRAKAVLVFLNIVKAGMGFGGSYGEGVLLKSGKAVDYYNAVTGSWGLQVGAQSYGYAVFLMKDTAVKYLEDSHGWEIGVGPNGGGSNRGCGKKFVDLNAEG